MTTQFNTIKFKGLIYETKQVFDVTHINFQHSQITLNINMEHVTYPANSVYLMRYFGSNIYKQEMYEFYTFSTDRKNKKVSKNDCWILVYWNNTAYIYNCGSKYLYRNLEIKMLETMYCLGFIEENFLAVIEKIKLENKKR